jgi:DNA-binding response OmpR family regulator
MKALVVEDDLKSQCLLAKVLAEHGHEVTTFENAEQAILAYQKEFYPLLFVDVGLPGMDGLHYCRWIRSQPRGERSYVIAAIEPGVPADVQEVLDAGANDFLAKPYQLDQLRARLVIGERQMSQFFNRQQLEESLQNETERWSVAESELARVREECEAVLAAKDAELGGLRQQLAAMSESSAEEKALRGEIAKREEDLEKLREEIGSLWDRCGQLQEDLDTARQENLDAQERMRAAEQALESANQELARLKKLEAEFTEASKEKGLAEQVARAERELAVVRDELARQVREHTEELVKISEQMRASLEDRKRIENDLSEAHNELARRGRDQAQESLRLTDECRQLAAERRRLESELALRDQQQQAEQGRVAAERDDYLSQLKTESEQAARLRKALEASQDREAKLQSAHESALEDVRLHRDARKRFESRWRALLRLGNEMNRATTAEEVARVTAAVAQELVGWECFSLDAYVPDGDWIHPVLNLEIVEGRSRPVQAFHPGPQPTSLMRRALEDGPQLVIRSAGAGLGSDVAVLGHRTRRSVSLIYVPIAMAGRVMGFLSVRSGLEDAYQTEDMEILELIAAHCAGALARIESRTEPDSGTATRLASVSDLAVPAGT